MQNTIKRTGKTETKTTITAYGREWEVTITDHNDPYSTPRYNWKKGGYIQPLTRVFVSTPDEYDNIVFDMLGVSYPTVEMFPALALESAHTSRGVYPEVDKAWDRYNRAYVKGQSAILLAVAEISGVEEFRFDRHAGCTCSCSPGFVAKAGRRSRGTTISVSIEEVTA